MRDGQGLLETIIAIGIITSGLFAILTLVAANARVGEATALRFGAIQTAREGIEVVRAMRDSNWLAGSAWNTGLEGSGVDYSAIAVFDAATSTWSLVYGANALSENAARVIRRESNGETFFTQDASGGEGAGRTPYRRLIFVDPICESSDGARVTVTSGSSCGADRVQIGIRAEVQVAWAHRGQDQRVTVEETLYDWR